MTHNKGCTDIHLSLLTLIYGRQSYILVFIDSAVYAAHTVTLCYAVQSMKLVQTHSPVTFGSYCRPQCLLTRSHTYYSLFANSKYPKLCELSVGVFPILIFFMSRETVEPHSAKRAQLKASL